MKKTVRTALFCVIACILAITGAFSIAPPTLAAAATEGAQAAADPITTGTWKDWGLDDTTQNVGRIWTDKSVSAGNIDLTGAGGHHNHSEGRLRLPHGVQRSFVHVESARHRDDAPRHRARP